MTKKTGHYYSCVFHNGFRLDMNFLTKYIWLSLWKIQEFSLLGSSLKDLKSYTISNHCKFINSTKYYQHSPSKLAQITDECEKEKQNKESLHKLFRLRTTIL